MLKLFTYMATRGVLSSSDDDEEKNDLGFSIKPRQGGLKQWTFSTSQKSTQIALSENNRVASNQSASVYAYLVGDVSFKKGKHAWRTTVRSLSGSNQWLFVGIGSRKHFTDNSSYNDTSVYGITSCNNVYRAGVAVSTGSTIALRAGDTLDCLLDIDTRTLRFATSTGQLCTIDNIPVPHDSLELGPHYILYLNNSVKVEAISVGKFGKF